jgi:hypothetical protein
MPAGTLGEDSVERPDDTPPRRYPSTEWQVLRLALYASLGIFAMVVFDGFVWAGHDGLFITIGGSIGFAVCLAGLAASCDRWIVR